MTDLSALPGDLNTNSQASAINDRSDVVGEAGLGNTVAHPFLWRNGVMKDLGRLGGPSAFALAINNHSQVVGGSLTALSDPDNPGGFVGHAFLWSGGQVHDLETTPIEVHSEAHGINNRGQAVGLGCCMGDILRALLCQNGNVYDLNELIPATSGWFLQEVDSINDRGEIWGTGRILPGKSTPFCFIPSRDTVARSRLGTIPKVWRERMQPGLHYRRASVGAWEGIGHTVLRGCPDITLTTEAGGSPLVPSEPWTHDQPKGMALFAGDRHMLAAEDEPGNTQGLWIVRRI